MITANEARKITADIDNGGVIDSVDMIADIDAHIAMSARLGNRFVFVHVPGGNVDEVIEKLRASSFLVNDSKVDNTDVVSICIGW